MAINPRRLLLISLVLLAGAMGAGQDAPDAEILELSPMQIVAKSLEMRVHYSTQGDKKTVEYIRVKNVAQGSIAGRAGLKNGDRIVAIEGWRLKGQELSALDRTFPLKLQDGARLLTFTVCRPHHDEEHDVTFRYPQKERVKNGPNLAPATTPQAQP